MQNRAPAWLYTFLINECVLLFLEGFLVIPDTARHLFHSLIFLLNPRRAGFGTGYYFLCLPHTGWLSITEIYFISVVEARNFVFNVLVSLYSSETFGVSSVLELSSFCWPKVSPGCTIINRPHGHSTHCALCVCVLSSFFIRLGLDLGFTCITQDYLI